MQLELKSRNRSKLKCDRRRKKVATKSKVDEAATTIKQAIDKAVNNSEVDNAIDVGKTAINNIEADNSAKSKAIKHLQELVKQQMTK